VPFMATPAQRARVSQLGGPVFAVIVACSVVSAQTPAPPTIPPQPADAVARTEAMLKEAVSTATIDAPPATLRISNRDIVVFRATLLLRPPAARAAAANRLISSIISEGSPAIVSSRALAGGYAIRIGPQDAVALVPADLDPTGSETLEEVAQTTVSRLQLAIDEAFELRTPRLLFQAIGLSLLATLALFVLLRLLVRGHTKVRRAAERVAERQLQRLPGGEIVRASRLPDLARYVVSLVSIVVALVLVYSWLAYILRRFPYTRPWGEALRGFLIQRVTAIGAGVLNALPDLFTVAVIVVITRMLVRLSGLVFEAVEKGRATFPGIYPETAQSTRRLMAGLLWLFALALAYPYLPGSETDAFKGVSVFIGLMISLSSSGIVNQVMSGLTLTYSRALRLNDFVRVGDLEGTVMHLGSLSTKLKTPRGEEITIPNAVMVSTQTTNYSRYADGEGVFVPTSVTIGYDRPWRQVKALLLQAAARTSGIRATPRPVVRQSALRDSYIEYTLLISLENPASKGPTLDALHGNILDAFNQHGVQIMTPNYEGDPDRPIIVPRERWFAEPAVD